jgi:hypothetical protein
MADQHSFICRQCTADPRTSLPVVPRLGGRGIRIKVPCGMRRSTCNYQWPDIVYTSVVQTMKCSACGVLFDMNGTNPKRKRSAGSVDLVRNKEGAAKRPRHIADSNISKALAAHVPTGGSTDSLAGLLSKLLPSTAIDAKATTARLNPSTLASRSEAKRKAPDAVQAPAGVAGFGSLLGILAPHAASAVDSAHDTRTKSIISQQISSRPFSFSTSIKR